MTEQQREHYLAVLATVGERATEERQRGVSEKVIAENAEIRFKAWIGDIE